MTSRFLALCVLLLSATARAAEPTAAELMRQYDSIMGPTNMEGVTQMTAHRDDDTERTYKMRMLKSGDDKFRLWFQEPAAVRGQEILRQGDNNWIYMPNLKRAIRMASRDNFQGGDFNNADVLRVNYEADYEGSLNPNTEGVADAYLLELKAKTKEASYDKVKLWLRKSDSLPIKGEFYTASGKMLRSAEYLDVKDFGGNRRPSRIVMKNMLNQKRYSTMIFDSVDIKAKPSPQKFVLDDLGH
jgi:outer membrane lipoprotein-sorting protein